MPEKRFCVKRLEILETILVREQCSQRLFMIYTMHEHFCGSKINAPKTYEWVCIYELL